MIDLFVSGGLIMWPLLALALGVVAVAVRAAITLRGLDRAADPAEPPSAKADIRGRTLTPILFWGGVALLVGALGTVIGLVIMARRIGAAGGASAGLVWGGIGVTLVSFGFGILIFLLSGFLWLGLDSWRRRLTGRSSGKALIWFLLSTTGVVGGCGDPDGGRFAVSDSAGVRLAGNAGPDRPFSVALERLSSLQPPDSALTAVPWGVVADPATGRIFVADGTSERVVVFDAEGRFVGTIGRAGEGPGEFLSATALDLDPFGALAVWDARRGIISRWTAEGDLLNEQRAPVSYWGPGFAIGRAGVVAVTQITTGNERRQSLVRASGTGDPQEIFAVTRELVRLDLPGVNMPAPRIFAPDLIWAEAGDTAWVLNPPEYRIDAYARGRPVTSVRRDIEPVPVTDEMAAARVEVGPFRGFMRRTGMTAAQIVAAVGHEEVTSPVQWLTVHPAGGLWVSRGSGGAVPDHIDVFASDGRYRGTFESPGLPVAFVSDSVVVILEMTDLGEPVLGLYGVGAGRDTALRSVPASERALGAGEFRDCGACPVMVEIPPGPFVMGRAAGEAPTSENPRRPEWTERAEEPRIQGQIDYPFALGKYEVTWREWERCVEAGACDSEPDDEGFGRGDRPVIHVSRPAALEYVAWLSEHTEREYRLPSEAEWEYAARAGTTTARWWGDELGVGKTVCDGCGSRWDDRSTAPVGSFPPNPFGLHDMLGNVYEWIADCWHPSHEGQPAAGTARIETSPWWQGGACEWPMHKGGAWSFYAWTTRAAKRGFWRPDRVPPPWPDHSRAGGFRVAAEPNNAEP